MPWRHCVTEKGLSFSPHKERSQWAEDMEETEKGI